MKTSDETFLELKEAKWVAFRFLIAPRNLYTIIPMKKEKKKKKSPEEIKMDKWIKAMEEDVPSTHGSKSMYELERDLGHGFWGNSTTGYITDEQLRRMP